MDFDFKLPGLGRPESSRPKRVGEAIKSELSILLIQKIADPALAEVAVSKVVVTPDMKQAKIYYTVPTGKDSRNAMKGLKRAKGFFRSHLAKTLDLRYTPDLFFFFDSIHEEAERIDTLFRLIEEERNK